MPLQLASPGLPAGGKRVVSLIGRSARKIAWSRMAQRRRRHAPLVASGATVTVPGAGRIQHIRGGRDTGFRRAAAGSVACWTLLLVLMGPSEEERRVRSQHRWIKGKAPRRAAL